MVRSGRGRKRGVWLRKGDYAKDFLLGEAGQLHSPRSGQDGDISGAAHVNRGKTGNQKNCSRTDITEQNRPIPDSAEFSKTGRTGA